MSETEFTSDVFDPADGEQRSTKRAGHDSELVVIRNTKAAVDMLEQVPFFQRMAVDAIARMRHLREHECAGCRVDTQQHRQCKSRNDSSLDHGIDDDPMCKHAPAEKVKQREKERVTTRYDRLVRAGCHDAEILKYVPGSVHSLRPPFAWFTNPLDASEYDRAAGLVLKVAKREHKYPALFLSGRVGSGKSMCAAGGLATVDRGGLWLPATHVEDGERWRALVSRAHAASFVVVDDLGRERDGWPVEALKSLITDLLDSSTPLVVTTNLAPPEFEPRYLRDPDASHLTGARLQSRMNQRADWTGCGNENLRAYASKEKRSGNT